MGHPIRIAAIQFLQVCLPNSYESLLSGDIGPGHQQGGDAPGALDEFGRAAADIQIGGRWVRVHGIAA